MKIALPDVNGQLTDYHLIGNPIPPAKLGQNPARVVFSAAHVVADPFSPNEPTGRAAVDWTATLAFRRHLAGMGLGIAEARIPPSAAWGWTGPARWN